MSNQEKADFKELYDYVRKQVLMYDDSQSLPSKFVLMLKGLKKGKYIETKKQEDRADYSYKTILYTFQICKPQIDYALNNVDFNNENHKFNYIVKIVESNLNDVYIRLKKIDEQKTRIKELDTENLLNNNGCVYTKKTKNIRKNLNDLW